VSLDLAAARPWLITRPAAAGESLTQALAARGCDARWLPAFDLGPAPDETAARATLAQLERFELAVLVSPAAVRATRALVGERPWPPDVAMGAVGSGTHEAIRAAFGDAPTIIAPEADHADGEADTGSEVFWRALSEARAAGRLRCDRVLLLRAEQGRDWLREHFAAAGAQVTMLAVYSRRARRWSTDDRGWIEARLAGPAPLMVITSSEAVGALFDAAAEDRVRAWFRRGRALALHPRIVERLHEADVADARCVPSEVEALLAAARA
jgi:uroporphyrinogen-III synthase